MMPRSHRAVRRPADRTCDTPDYLPARVPKLSEPRSRERNAVAMAPIRQATAQIPNAPIHATSRDVPPNQSRDRPNNSVPMNPPAKPTHEYTATVVPFCHGSATASRPEVRLEKLPCTTKPAASARTTTQPYDNIGAKPNNAFTSADARNTPMAVVRRPRRNDSSLPYKPAGTPSKPTSAPVISMLQPSVAPPPWFAAQNVRNTTIHCRKPAVPQMVAV